MARSLVIRKGKGFSRTWKKELKKIDKSYGVGFHKESRHFDGQFVAAIAAFQEFGTGNIPARPFMRQAIDSNLDNLKRAYFIAMKSDNLRPRALEIVARKLLAGIQDQIISIKKPRNAKSTIRRKGFDNPLIETGLMLESVKSKRLS